MENKRKARWGIALSKIRPAPYQNKVRENRVKASVGGTKKLGAHLNRGLEWLTNKRTGTRFMRFCGGGCLADRYLSLDFVSSRGIFMALGSVQVP